MNNHHRSASVRDAVALYEERHKATFNPKAALIDMDGTLLDTMKGHTLAWHRLATELGIEATRDEFYLYEGMTGAATINKLFRRAFNRDATREEITELYARKTGYFNELPKAGTIPGAATMIETLIRRGIKRVLVTGSGQLSNLERLDTDFPGGFAADMRITAHNVSRGKPDPEPYLKAMALAGTSPCESIVIENAPSGVEAGVRSGAFTVAVTTGPIPAEEMWKAGADMVFPTMTAFAEALPDLLSNNRL
ncbi:MAG: HAD hydrolase-like protein [Muribaculaceae bacterium]|nr:HAD hydrolase-like protein [Muribaculaceae bacterium]